MFESRILEIRKNLPPNTAAIITGDADCFYLSGFNHSEGMVLITENHARFFVDFRYIEAARDCCRHMEVELTSSFLNDINKRLKAENIRTVYICAQSVTVSQRKAFVKVFDGTDVSDEIDIDGILKNMRAVKTESETALIKSAQKITDRAFSYILGEIAAGRTEREIALDLEFFMRKNGSEGVAFDTICVSGKNSSKPHGVPTDKKVEPGDFITLDFGAVVGGYRSDMTRTVCVGKPSEKQTEVYNTVLKAQLAAINAVKAGVVCKDIDKIARDIIEKAGYEGCFGHGLGHSVGIEIHENPAFNTRCGEILKAGTVITVEPGIYIQNDFGVRIEDMIIVTENGCEDITASDKQLIVI